MNTYTNSKIKRSQNAAETLHPTHPQKNKHRVILNESINRRYDQDALKNLTRKSIDVTLNSHHRQGTSTFYQGGQPSKPYYRRVGHNFKKQTANARYEEEERDRETRMSSKSPYIRVPTSKQEKEMQAKSTSLNKSSQKIRSGQLLKQNSPRHLFYRQPRSSLSQHYDPSIETSLHKRRISAVGDDKNGILDEAK